jgi:glucose-6-phosphate 1-dehydrogenase
MSELQAGMVMQEDRPAPERPGDPCVLVIFGASGDLTRRLLIPSLYNLAHDKLLTPHFAVVGMARQDSTHEEFRQAMHQAIHESNRVGHLDPASWESLEQRLYYVPGSFQDPAGYTKVAEVLKQCDRDWGTKGNYLFYLATPPTFVGEIVQQLGQADLAQEHPEDGGGWRRVIIEKPFGHDLTSARALNGPC